MTAFASLPPDRRPIASKTVAAAKGVRELTRRTMHGGTGWIAGLVEAKFYQPQDQHDGTGGAGQDGGRNKLAEPDDAEITGGRRSLMRRLSGLNVMQPKERAVRATILSTTVIKAA